MSTTATKMMDWGDKVVGFQQLHVVEGWAHPAASVRFHLGDVVEIEFSTTVSFGGGVQHSAEGSIVLSRDDAHELGAALLGDMRAQVALSAGRLVLATAAAAEDPVVEANRQLLLDRSRVGIEKYGVTLDAANLSRVQVLQHALEEALDLANYLQTLIRKGGA